MALPDYNQQFLQKVVQGAAIANNAVKYGIQVRTVSQADIPSGTKQYWRVVGIHHLTGEENRGNHHAYCEVLDEEGRRINGARLILNQDGMAPVFAVVDKPANEAGTNFPLWSSSRANVSVQWPADNPLPSEEVRGVSTTHADEEAGNTWGHHSFYIVFQRTQAPTEGGTTTDTTETPPSDGGETSPSLEETIAAIGEPQIIPLNPESSFYKVAKQQNLGERLTVEYDVSYQDKNYLAQIYERGIVYAEVGDWGNIKVIPRTN